MTCQNLYLYLTSHNIIRILITKKKKTQKTPPPLGASIISTQHHLQQSSLEITYLKIKKIKNSEK